MHAEVAEPVTLLILAFPDMNQIKHLRPPETLKIE